MTKRKNPKDYKKRGAPEWEYDQILGEEICEAVATSTDSLKLILERNPHFPSKDVIRKWRFRLPTFANMYTQAKQLQAELFAEECSDISDDGRNDWMVNLTEEEQGMGWKLNGEHVQRSRLRIDTRKWIACKLAPRVYGERQVVDHNIVSHETSLKELD